MAGLAKGLVRGLGRLRAEVRRPGGLGPGDRVLVARADHLGDLLMALPAVASLAGAVEGPVDLLVKRAYVPLLEGQPGIGRVHGYTLPWADPARAGDGWDGLLDLARELAERRYRAVLELTGDPRTQALLGLLATPVAVGAEGAATRLLGWVPFRPRAPHQVERGLEAAALLGGVPVPPWPRLVLPEPARAWARARLAALGAPRVLIHPGAAGTAKSWGAARFAELGARLAAAGRTPVFVVGPGEEELLEPVRGMAGLTGLPLMELAALSEAVGVFVGNDSGPGHLAAAAGARVVSVFGPTRPARTAPRGRGATVVARPMACRPCWSPGEPFACPTARECLAELPVEAVLEAVLQSSS